MNTSDERPWQHLMQIAWELQESHRRQNEPQFGKITFSQLRALVAIFDAHDQSLKLKTLADVLKQRPASTSETVRVLEERGLVCCRTCADDARAMTITLTEAGAEMRRYGIAFIGEQWQRLCADITPEERIVFERVLKSIFTKIHHNNAAK